MVPGVLLTALASVLIPLIGGWCLVRAPQSSWTYVLLGGGVVGGIGLAYAVHPVAGMVAGSVATMLLGRDMQVQDRPAHSVWQGPDVA